MDPPSRKQPILEPECSTLLESGLFWIWYLANDERWFVLENTPAGRYHYSSNPATFRSRDAEQGKERPVTGMLNVLGSPNFSRAASSQSQPLILTLCTTIFSPMSTPVTTENASSMNPSPASPQVVSFYVRVRIVVPHHARAAAWEAIAIEPPADQQQGYRRRIRNRLGRIIERLDRGQQRTDFIRLMREILELQGLSLPSLRAGNVRGSSRNTE